jgi:membrane protein DedA with SNARE-associated domain
MKLLDQLNKDWKKALVQFLIIAGIFLSGVLVGMTSTQFEALKLILINFLSNLLNNIVWFILGYFVMKSLAKQVPLWLEDWEKRRIRVLRIEKAVNSRY